MSRVFDYNGAIVAPSNPVKQLKRVKRSLVIDSGDRDVAIFPNNGNFTIYLPRAYERVTSVKIKSAEFPVINSVLRQWTGPDRQPGFTAPVITPNPVYFFLEAKGLNMSDETTLFADRSASTKSVFAKFVVSAPTSITLYNESSDANQEIEFFPALTKLDRFQFRLRTHPMNSEQYMYWPSGGGEWSISLEIESLENSFDEFSTIETRLGDRS
jgi:hypothetical protein